jgi:hypothetical protein
MDFDNIRDTNLGADARDVITVGRERKIKDEKVRR